MVQIIDPATKKVLQEVQVDADGNVLASVPDNKSYDLNILGTAHVIPGEGIENAALVTSFLHTAMFDASGEPLSEGVKVIVRGKGETHEFLTAVDGTISPHLEEGDYELEINGQKFAANTLRAHDLAHEGGSPLQFQLAPDDTDLDYDAMERGREHRGADPEA
jgi:hypothetical protein